VQNTTISIKTLIGNRVGSCCFGVGPVNKEEASDPTRFKSNGIAVVSSVLSHDRDKSLTFFLWRVWCLTKSDLDDFFCRIYMDVFDFLGNFRSS
jgi:hypothetical protein